MTDTIRRLLRQELGARADDITDDSPLVSSKLLDSVTIVYLIATLQKQEAIRIPQDAFEPADFETVNRIRALLDRCGQRRTE